MYATKTLKTGKQGRGFFYYWGLFTLLIFICELLVTGLPMLAEMGKRPLSPLEKQDLIIQVFFLPPLLGLIFGLLCFFFKLVKRIDGDSSIRLTPEELAMKFDRKEMTFRWRDITDITIEDFVQDRRFVVFHFDTGYTFSGDAQEAAEFTRAYCNRKVYGVTLPGHLGMTPEALVEELTAYKNEHMLR